jgi:hypothetical protein
MAPGPRVTALLTGVGIGSSLNRVGSGVGAAGIG